MHKLHETKVWKDLVRPTQNSKGVAIIMAIAALLIITTFAMELIYDSNVEYVVNSQNLNRLKSYYAAKSGVKLSLLRIKIYQQAQASFGQQLGDSALLDEIWKFPFAWPLPTPDELNSVDKDSFAKAAKESTMDASYMVTIEDEGSKIDVNDLASPSKALRDAATQQLTNIFEQKRLTDENFAREYSNFRFDELIMSIGDWMSEVNAAGKGGDKRQGYAQINSEVGSDYFPPNRAFRTVAELHMIPGMTDELFRIIEPKITIYGMKGVNPNIATKEVLKSLDQSFTDEIVDEIVKRREDPNQGGPFKCDQNGGSQDFWNFVQQRGARLLGNIQVIPITCDRAINFKIRSTGQFANVAREITAIVLDIDKVATKVNTLIQSEKPDSERPVTPGTPAANPGAPGATAGNQKSQPAKGPPRIVFWTEK